MASKALEYVGPIKRGRPSDYTPELADYICSRIACGETLTSICLEEDMPDRVTVWRWLRAHPDFSQLYAQAREHQVECEADEIRDIADDSGDDIKVEMTENGPKVTFNSGNVSRARLRIETRQWRAERLNRRVFGTKVEHEVRTNNAAPAGAEQLPAGIAWLAGQLPGAQPAAGPGPDHSDVGEK